MTRLGVRQGVARQRWALIAAIASLPALAGGCAQDDGGQTYDDGNGLGKVGGKDQPEDNGSPPPTFDAAAPYGEDATDASRNADSGVADVETVALPNLPQVPVADDPCYAPNSNLELATAQSPLGCSCSGAHTACVDGVAMVCSASGDSAPSAGHWFTLETGGCPADDSPCAGRMNDVMRCLDYFQSCLEEGDYFCGREPLTSLCDDGVLVSSQAQCERDGSCRKVEDDAYCNGPGGRPPIPNDTSSEAGVASDPPSVPSTPADAAAPLNVAESDCAGACALVDECTSEPTDDCMSRCMDSPSYDEEDESRCLSQRIFWIDEEGCTSILGAYDGFDPQDTCR